MMLDDNTEIRIATDSQQPPEARLDAIALLGKQRLRRAVPALVEIIRTGPSTFSWAASVSIVQIESRRATVPLIELVRSNAAPVIRQAAVYALGRLRDSRAVPTLVSVLLDKTLPEALRGEAAEALGESGCTDTSVLAALRTSTTDPSAEVRFFAAFALGLLRDWQAKNHLTRLLSDQQVVSGYGSVAAEANWALDRIEGTEDDVEPPA